MVLDTVLEYFPTAFKYELAIQLPAFTLTHMQVETDCPLFFCELIRLIILSGGWQGGFFSSVMEHNSVWRVDLKGLVEFTVGRCVKYHPMIDKYNV